MGEARRPGNGGGKECTWGGRHSVRALPSRAQPDCPSHGPGPPSPGGGVDDAPCLSGTPWP
eukprot:13384529-Alexandrium_andersonii.AAC.1